MRLILLTAVLTASAAVALHGEDPSGKIATTTTATAPGSGEHSRTATEPSMRYTDRLVGFSLDIIEIPAGRLIPQSRPDALKFWRTETITVFCNL